MKLCQIVLLCFISVWITGCGPHSLEDFREEGEGITRSLIKELQLIHTRDDLLQSSSRLQKLFQAIVEIIIAAHEFKEKFPHFEQLELLQTNHDLSDQLRIELNRIYSLEGGREIIEKCQEQSLHRLDAFEKRLIKQKKF